MIIENLPSTSEIFEHETVNIVSRARYSSEKEEFWHGADDLEELLASAKKGEGFPERHKISDLKKEAPQWVHKDLEYVSFLRDSAADYQELRNGNTPEYDLELRKLLLPLEQIADQFSCPEIEVRGSMALGIFPSTARINHGRYGKDSALYVSGKLEEEEVKIFTYDNGPGVEDAENLFKGSSTGLPVSQTISREYGGSLEYFEPEDGGFGLSWTLKRSRA